MLEADPPALTLLRILEAGIKNPVHPKGVTPMAPTESESLEAFERRCLGLEADSGPRLILLIIFLSPDWVTMVAWSFLMIPLASQNLVVKDFRGCCGPPLAFWPPVLASADPVEAKAECGEL